MTDAEKLRKLLDALEAWILEESLTPPHYVQHEIDRNETPPQQDSK